MRKNGGIFKNKMEDIEMKIYHAQVNHLENPMGFRMERTVFSWKVKDAEGKKQSYARIRVASDAAMEHLLFDSGEDDKASSLFYPVKLDLEPRTRYYWNVEAGSDAGETAVSEVQFFETGKRNEAWTGKWISCDSKENRHPYFEKEIVPAKEVAKARLYVCGLGLYEVYVDEKRVGDEYLTPYSNDYNEWVQYQTYDVTEEVSKQGMLRVLLGNGWYKARFGFSAFEDKGFYGNEWKLIAELHLTYADGSEEVIGTDESWQVRRSKIAFSNLYDGEHRDDTLSELPLEKAVFCEAPKGELTERMSLPVTIHETFEPKELLHTPAGELVFDMGQEFTGIFKLHVNVPAGTKVHVQTGEILQRGNFYNDNLRSAKSEYIYISDGTEMDLVPHFTFYGYRYVKIEGIPDLKKEDFTGLSYYSNITATGWMKTGSDLVNQLISNVRWGLKCNFVDVPTDCPQRDERLGWTGDAQVFFRTATFNRDVQTFFNKWMADVAAEQYADGAVNGVYPVTHRSRISAGWGDVATIIPWQHYMAYGDLRMLERQYPSMKKWVDYITSQAENDLWSKGNSYGDWVFFSYADDKDGRSAVTIRPFIQQCFYAHSLDLVVRTARLLGRTEDAAKYEALHKRAVDAFRNEYVTPNGMLVSDTQTAYTLALMFDLLPEAQRAGAAKRLVDNVNRYGHITTGFLGTPYICEVLTRFGYEDVAYELLLNKKIPSWLYPISMGATTIWERWNSMLPNGMVNSNSMVSFNHYAYGAIGDWLYRWAAGLQEAAPGFREIRIKPYLNDHFTSMKAEQRTPYGLASSGWTKEGDALTLTVEIPANTTAEVYVPSAAADKVTESGRALDGRSDLKVAGWDDGYTLVRLGSGRYEFRSTLK